MDDQRADSGPAPTGGGLLDGLRVLEIGEFVAVPYAGYLLSVLGAEVVRLDLGPDPAGLCQGTEITLFEGLNAAKSTVADPAGIDISAFDLVLADSRELERVPPAARLTMSLEVIPGQFPTPPLADSALLSALSAATWVMGEPSRPPLSMPDYTAAFVVGSVFAGAAVAKVVSAETGVHTLSGLTALSTFVDQNSTSYLHSGIGWRREGRRAAGSAGIYPYGLFDCSDGQVALIGRSRKNWADIAHSLGAGSVHEKYPDPFDIALHHADEVDAELAPFLSRRTKAEVMRAAQEDGVLAVPVAGVADVLRYDNLTQERDFWTEVGTTRFPGLPFLIEA